jgi:Tfp pilus assembly protein PilX
MKLFKRKRGIALAVVLVFCTALLGFITILLMNTKHQKGSHAKQYEQTRALMAARSAMQLAVYKFRVLVSEFYRIHEIEKQLRLSGGDPGIQAKLNAFSNVWLADMDTATTGSPAEKIKNRLDAVDTVNISGGHSFKVEEFRLVTKQNEGYIKDYVKIRVSGIYGNSEKILEDLIEVQIAAP